MKRKFSQCRECQCNLGELATTRRKKCPKCTQQKTLKKRREDKVKTLQHRLYNAFRQSKLTTDSSLWSKDTVKRLQKNTKVKVC